MTRLIRREQPRPPCSSPAVFSPCCAEHVCTVRATSSTPEPAPPCHDAPWLVPTVPQAARQPARPATKERQRVSRLCTSCAPQYCLQVTDDVGRPLWRRRPLSLAIALCVAVYTLCALRLRFLTEEKTWLPPFGALLGPPTLVVDVRDLRRVWEWEIAAGHYPSARKRRCHHLCYHASSVS